MVLVFNAIDIFKVIMKSIGMAGILYLLLDHTYLTAHKCAMISQLDTLLMKVITEFTNKQTVLLHTQEGLNQLPNQ